jgi:sulfoxide reductase catalytic subunit YedY
MDERVTPKEIYLNRRSLVKAMGFASVMPLMPAVIAKPAKAFGLSKTDDTPTDFEKIKTYNNFYEFGTGKEEPHQKAQHFKTEPWAIEVGGLCDAPARVSLQDFLNGQKPEERVYRFRCVEGWSMVVPWQGIALSALLKPFKPKAEAKYVAFETLYDPAQMPGQKTNVLDWPYVEGLRMDEAMHPLTILATGIYDEPMPKQNGAPIRLVVPWKYGFKSIKSIVKINFTADEPKTSWNIYAPKEYGFYSNVNPHVSHPRWSQATERRLGEILRRDTLMFNGYEKEVASLYEGMDLATYF